MPMNMNSVLGRRILRMSLSEASRFGYDSRLREGTHREPAANEPALAGPAPDLTAAKPQGYWLIYLRLLSICEKLGVK